MENPKEKLEILTNKVSENFVKSLSATNITKESNPPTQIISRALKEEHKIALKRLQIDHKRVLHSGKFSRIYYGLLELDGSGSTEQNFVDVAVKKVKARLEVSYFETILDEINLLNFLGRHENIVSILGTITTTIRKREIIVLTEFCAKRDLLSYLRKCKKKENFQDLWNWNVLVSYRSIAEYPQTALRMENFDSAVKLSTLDLLRWATHIANGMVFLGEKDIIHGDLTAQSVLLTSDNVAKIANFGLSTQLMQYLGNPKAFNHTTLPLSVRSMAIECFLDLSFSIQSDIWSFGVLLWEIFTLGEVPYSETNSFLSFVKHLSFGDPLDSPEFGNCEINQLMLKCLSRCPGERPSFTKIRTKIQLMESSLNSLTFAKCFKRRLTTQN